MRNIKEKGLNMFDIRAFYIRIGVLIIFVKA